MERQYTMLISITELTFPRPIKIKLIDWMRGWLAGWWIMQFFSTRLLRNYENWKFRSWNFARTAGAVRYEDDTCMFYIDLLSISYRFIRYKIIFTCARTLQGNQQRVTVVPSESTIARASARKMSLILREMTFVIICWSLRIIIIAEHDPLRVAILECSWHPFVTQLTFSCRIDRRAINFVLS